MASHVPGIAIVIKAFLPTGETLDEQFDALSLVKYAHATGDYSKVLAAANIDEVKAEQKTRRIEDQPAAEPAQTSEPIDGASSSEPSNDDDVPAFLKKSA